MKQILKIIILLWGYIFNKNWHSKVIYYHDLGVKYTEMGTSFDLFKNHIRIINKSGYHIVPNITQKNNEVMICFDDGWAGIYDYKDFFMTHHIYPTIFIAVSLIGQDGYLTSDQIKELKLAGFNFECHTWSHKDLTLFDDNGLEHELEDSKTILEKQYGFSFNAICYPMGRFSEKVFNACEKAGYRKQYSSISGGYYDLENKGLICRNCAQYSSPFEFWLLLNSKSFYFHRRYINQQYSGIF